MNLFRTAPPLAEAADATLVMHSLGGDRDAFCEIVSRYQNLLCSLAYSAVGDIKHSEDIAQEAFVDAWKKLDTLSDPEKLKAWLCGILRFKVSRHHRKEVNQPVKGADDIAEQDMADADKGSLESAAIDSQQQALLWKVLDSMDDTYREPLILFYREEQSVQRVAAELDLSEDTAKQRLSRGRKLLKEAMSSFVEDALQKSKPGVAFTAGVLAAISGVSPPAKAAALGAGAAKTSSVFGVGAMLTLLASFSGVISSFFGVKAGLAQSRTQRERQHVIKTLVVFFAVAIIYVAAMFALKYWVYADHQVAMLATVVSQVVVVAFVLCYLWLSWWMIRSMQTLRAQERIFNPEAFTADVDQAGARQREYISSFRLFGVPLFHFQFGMPEASDKAAFAWIAGGSYARGLLFAWGGVAIAPVSVGIVSVGVITVGAVGFGLLSMGTVAVGVIAFGASAIGYKAYASLSSLGWDSALSGGFSIANQGAIGPIAFAEHVNSELAEQIVQLTHFLQSYQWALAFIAILVIIPAAMYAHKVNQRMKPG